MRAGRPCCRGGPATPGGLLAREALLAVGGRGDLAGPWARADLQAHVDPSRPVAVPTHRRPPLGPVAPVAPRSARSHPWPPVAAGGTVAGTSESGTQVRVATPGTGTLDGLRANVRRAAREHDVTDPVGRQRAPRAAEADALHPAHRLLAAVALRGLGDDPGGPGRLGDTGRDLAGDLRGGARVDVGRGSTPVPATVPSTTIPPTTAAARRARDEVARVVMRMRSVLREPARSLRARDLVRFDRARDDLKDHGEALVAEATWTSVGTPKCPG
jgi:hypothetical protein